MRPGEAWGARGRGARGANFTGGRGARGAGQRPPPVPCQLWQQHILHSPTGAAEVAAIGFEAVGRASRAAAGPATGHIRVITEGRWAGGTRWDGDASVGGGIVRDGRTAVAMCGRARQRSCTADRRRGRRGGGVLSESLRHGCERRSGRRPWLVEPLALNPRAAVTLQSCGRGAGQALYGSPRFRRCAGSQHQPHSRRGGPASNRPFKPRPRRSGRGG